jgi:hypothetical protein
VQHVRFSTGQPASGSGRLVPHFRKFPGWRV